MKLQAYISHIDINKKIVVLKFKDSKVLKSLMYNDAVELITDIGKKHHLRKKIFSLLGYLWQQKNYDIFGELKDKIQRAVESCIKYKGEQYAREFYRFNVHLQCRFTKKMLGAFPTDEGIYTRMIGEVAKSLSNESGITTDELKTFYQELEYLVVLHNGDEFLEEWIKKRDI